MKKNVWIPILGLVIGGCTPFPTDGDLQGGWVEKTIDTNKYHFYFANSHWVYFTSPGSVPDTLGYWLDSENQQLHLKSPYSSSSSHYRIWWNGKDQLIIEGLGFWIPEVPPPKTEFERE